MEAGFLILRGSIPDDSWSTLLFVGQHKGGVVNTEQAWFNLSL